jgi:hypothetical protein
MLVLPPNGDRLTRLPGRRDGACEGGKDGPAAAPTGLEVGVKFADVINDGSFQPRVADCFSAELCKC